MSMSFPPEVQEDVQVRLRRAEGQMRGIQNMLAEGRDCREVVAQLAAVKSAIDRVGYRLVAAGLRHCVEEGSGEEMTESELERLFLQIS